MAQPTNRNRQAAQPVLEALEHDGWHCDPDESGNTIQVYDSAGTYTATVRVTWEPDQIVGGR